jgi:hypothetical protein
VHGEVGALVAAIAGDGRPRPAAPTAQPAVPQRPAPTPFVVPDALRRPPSPLQRARWIVAAAVVLTVLAAGAAWALTRSTQGGKPAAAATTPPPAPSHTSTPPPSPHTRTIPALAPPTAGFVARVTQEPQGSCQASAACAITVKIYVQQLTEMATMNWSFVVIDRCTGERTPVPGGTMIAQPWWQKAYDTRTVQLPPGRAIAVVALVETPVRAASAPLLVPDGSASC